jgi:hypothetical protein
MENIEIELSSEFGTLYQDVDKKRWNYNTEIGIAVEKLRRTINTINNEIYKELFTVALASILLDVSNLYRNGKCLSYKKNWKDRKLTEEDVFNKFDIKVKNELMFDIENYPWPSKVNNKDFLFYEDSRVGIENKVLDNTIDLIITSPPYLNSRDYTDTYMLELKTLRLTNTIDEIKDLRKRTIRSHVQIKWNDNSDIDNLLLKQTIAKLEATSAGVEMWNNSIIDMIRLYFVDIEMIFKVLYKKLKVGGRIYFNVSNSAYFNTLINTIEICSSIAENQGLYVKEIRKARLLKTSPQQQEKIGKLLEAVIVLEKR